MLAQGDYFIPIPGTKHIEFLQENWRAQAVDLTAEQLQSLDQLINPQTVMGQRYHITTTREIDTEGFQRCAFPTWNWK